MCGGGNIVKINFFWKKVKHFSFKTHTATICGHKTKRSGEITAFKDSAFMEMPLNECSSVDYCLDCIAKMTICCAWCKQPIFIGSPITLYSLTDDRFEIPEHAVIYGNDPFCVVGCLGWNCADSGADRAGFWVPGENGHGSVKRVPTSFEIMLESEGKSMLIVQNLGNINEAQNPILIPMCIEEN
jgi:hypothetical protein